ncbi:MAG TPA: hypothetical protein VGG48_05545 [Rhizomicrobium sp.]
MAYTFKKADHPLFIGEREYDTASDIRFTLFTSCIGVAVQNGQKVTGVHLSIYGTDGDKFDNTAAAEVAKLLGDKYEQALILGKVEIWEKQVYNAYTYLKSLLLVKPAIVGGPDGIYGARYQLDKFQGFQGAYFDYYETGDEQEDSE